MRRLALLALGLVAVAACRPLTFPCKSDGFCTRSGAQGVCQSSPSSKSSWCAFTDDACPTGLRWDPTAGDGLSDGTTGQCVAGFHWSSKNLMFGDGSSRDLFAVARVGQSVFAAGNLTASGFSAVLRSSDGGTSWMADTTPAFAFLYGAWASAPDDAWAVGAGATAIHFDGHSWQDASLGVGSGNLYGVFGTAKNDVVVVGEAAGSPIVYLWDGNGWSPSPGAIVAQEPLQGVWARALGSGTQIIAVGYAGTIVVSNDGAKSWTSPPSGTSSSLSAVWGSGSGEVWAVGDAGAIVYSGDNGATWSALTSGVVIDLHGIWGRSASDLYAVGGGENGPGVVLHSADGKTWQAMPRAQVAAQLLAVAGDDQENVIAVGGNAVVELGGP